MKKRLIENTAPGAENMDRTWMLTFWEAFSDLVIEIDARYNVSGILRKIDSTFTMDNIIGKSFLDIAVDKERAFAASELDVLKTENLPYRRFTFLSKLGRYYRWTLISILKDGVFMGFRGIGVDVTEQSLNEITLNWQGAIIEGSSNFISIADMDGKILYINPGAYKMTGYDPESGILPLERIFTSEHMEAIRSKGLKKALDSGNWISLSELVCKDGKRIPIEHNMFSVKDDKDETFLVGTIIRDITDFVEHEKKMEEARKAAEAANIAKSEFLSRMSHEIRTPMNAIIGMINIGMGSQDLEKKNYCFDRADRASKHLLGIINDILDMSKIEADKFELSFSEFNFEQTLKNVTSMANIRVEEKQQNFIINLGNDVPVFILSDELRLSQVITNLLTNAVKFTPEKGTIILKTEKIEEINDEVMLRIEVEDTGIGISKDQQEKLFMSFSQADSSITRKFGGTGLGLAISKRIVELMGGTIWVESELGLGSKFIFTIKAKKTDTNIHINKAENGIQYNSPHCRSSLNSFTLMVAEDVEINREIISAILEETGVSIEYAENGKIAFAMFNENPRKYDLILMDINMPEMDGYETTKKIREAEAERLSQGSQGVSIIAMTANVFKEDIEKCLASGMNDHIGKPIEPDALFRILNKYLKPRCS